MKTHVNYSASPFTELKQNILCGKTRVPVDCRLIVDPSAAAAASRKRAAPPPPEKIRRAAGPAEGHGRRRRRIFLGALRR